MQRTRCALAGHGPQVAVHGWPPQRKATRPKADGWDNRNTHTPASLYEAFPPDEALRLKERIAWHDTPKYGSWLNMAEIEIGVPQPQCLSRRLPEKTLVEQELSP